MPRLIRPRDGRGRPIPSGPMLRPSRCSSAYPFGRVRSGARRLRQAGAKPKKLPPRKPYRNAPELISGAPGGEINFYSNKDDENGHRLPGVSGRNRLGDRPRSEEHTSELQSLMRISYAVFCLKKKKNKTQHLNNITSTQREVL